MSNIANKRPKTSHTETVETIAQSSTTVVQNIISETVQEIEAPEIDSPAINEEITVKCNSCNQEGHQRANSRLCSNFRDRVCCSCGLSTHKSQRSRLCLNNAGNAKKVGLRIDLLPAVIRHDLGRMVFECTYCKAMMWMDEKLERSSKIHPQFQMCCGKGKYVVQRYSPTPYVITQLLINHGGRSEEFKNNIRAYNSSLSFTSMGVKLDESVANRRGGSYNFRIHGSVYHRIGSLLPGNGSTPSFAQIYIFDASRELENRHAIASHVDIVTLSSLQAMMHDVNPFVKDFKTMLALGKEQNGGIRDVRMLFQADSTLDTRRYNAPTSGTEIGLLLLGSVSAGEDGVRPNNRDIVLHLTEEGLRANNGDSSLKRINELNRCYDPMHYVLLFPQGEFGWCIDAATTDGLTEVTTMQFYSFHLMYRRPLDPLQPLVNHHMHLFGPLFQQYIVDMYAKVEQTRLNFIRFNQSQLRCEVYQGLQDAVVSGDADLASIGRKVILPSTFVGGPRHMAQLYQDALSIVRRFGKPDLFITFTCNPSWVEIQSALLYGQVASDRPDLCSRVFNMKLKALMQDIKTNQVFGRVVGYIYTIEFQKVRHTVIYLHAITY